MVGSWYRRTSTSRIAALDQFVVSCHAWPGIGVITARITDSSSLSTDLGVTSPKTVESDTEAMNRLRGTTVAF